MSNIGEYSEEREWKDAWYYFQGNLRYKLFYSCFKFLLRLHIFEQICARIISMENDCYSNGECIMCGCKTTALQMCNKSCNKLCYPPMMSKKRWLSLKAGGIEEFDGIKWTSNGIRFEKYEKGKQVD
jgi:hypothetical protein